MTSSRGKIVGLVFAWGAVTALILTTACARTRPNPNGPAAAPGAAAQGTPAPTPVPPPASGPAANASEDRVKTLPIKSASKVDDNKKQSAPDSSSKTEAVLDPSAHTAAQIFSMSEKQGPAVHGIKAELVKSSDGSDLYFCDGGQDDLQQTLKTRIDSVTDVEQKNADAAFAKSVLFSLTPLAVADDSSKLEIKFKVVRADTSLPMDFVATLNDDRSFKSGDLTTGDKIAIKGACMDTDKKACTVVYMKIEDASSGKVRTAHSLIRQTKATTFLGEVNPGAANNPDFDKLVGFIQHATDNPGHVGSLDGVRLTTAETINGSATFLAELQFKIDDKLEEKHTWIGYLVKPELTTTLDIPVKPLPVVGKSEGQESSVRSLIADSIDSVHLVRNDGRGNLQFKITVKATAANSKSDSLLFTIARIHNEVFGLKAQ